MIGTLRREVFDRLLIVNEHHLRQVLTEYLRHYNTARPHRALGQLAPAQAPARPPEINLAEHRIRRRQVLGGLTHEYQIAARQPAAATRRKQVTATVVYSSPTGTGELLRELVLNPDRDYQPTGLPPGHPKKTPRT